MFDKNDSDESDMKKIMLLNEKLPIKSELIYYCKKCKRSVNEKCLNQHFKIYSTLNLFVCQFETLTFI